ncbi:MAG TPA: hypothetical protein VMW72_01900 [Sedimentisphaerales bacterium]|nr:hypothetical protein [Sedimentisphaerales bacterium]
MWRTQIGDRILDGAEAILFAKALSSLLNEAIMGTLEDYKFYIESFDNLTFGQRISVLAIIGNGLLRKDVPLVRLTAILEGAIAAVFNHIENEIGYDIDTPESRSNWRELVVAARNQIGGEIEEIPEPTCTDMDKWKVEVEILSDVILFDTDYEDSKLYIDFPPEKSEDLREQMDIPDDYFMAIADDLTGEEAEAQIKELKKLCNSIIKPS